MYKLTILACFLALLSFSGCKEVDITPENNKEFPINIEVKQTASGVEISWPEVKINGFKNYFITRKTNSSFGSIGGGFTSGDTLWVIEDFSKTKVIDKNLPLVSKMSYQLTVESKDKTFQSNQVEFKRNDVISFDNLNYDSKLINPAKNLIYLSNFGSEITTINTETGKISEPAVLEEVAGKRFSFHQEDPENLYFIGNSEIVVYDAVTLALKQTLTLPSTTTNEAFFSVAFGNGRYYTTVNSYPTKVYMYDDKGGFIKTYTSNQNISSQMLIRSVPEQKRLLFFSNGGSASEAFFAALDNSGNILTTSLVKDNNIYPYYNNCAIAPNGKNLISGKKYVLDKNLKVLSTILTASGSNFTQDILYSPDSRYFIINEPFGNSVVMESDKYKVIKSIVTQTNNGSKFYFLTNSEIVAINETNINNGTGIFLKRLIITKSKFL